MSEPAVVGTSPAPVSVPAQQKSPGPARPEPSDPARPAWSGLRGRLVGAAGEVVAAFGAAALSVALGASVVTNPLDRIGQVSGVAALDLRFVVMGLLVVGACLLAARGRAQAWPTARRCAPAAIAGLTTGLIGGGILVALSGTDWPLFANSGDSGQLVRWADDLLDGSAIPANYPPFAIQAIAGLSALTGDTTAGALHTIQILATAAYGPIAYLAWRLVLTPNWALAVALVAAVPLLEPYKPYTTVVLVALVPVLMAWSSALRTAGALSWSGVAATGVGTGVVLGLLFNVYSGWFVWSAPGALVTTLVVFPWRTAARRGAALVGATVLGLVAVAAPHLFGILQASSAVQDRFVYFDVLVDPGYIAMWRNDLPGETGPWPPPGELAGVGIVTVLLAIGLGAAVALGARRTGVILLCSLLGGAWLLRLWLASQMYATGAVQLYPRTTPEILFCLLVLSILAVRYGSRALVDLVQRRGLRDTPVGKANRTRPAPARPTPRVTIGVLAAALLLGMSMGSSVADRHMPRNDTSVGLLAYVAQMVRQPDGTCPEASRNPDRCATDVDALLEPTAG